ncbi:hypothetical protein E5345_08970 [Propionibacterium sp. NM47_B9-13]|nr:hypothetical protein CP877_11855 [Cutibacterium modestum]TGY28377.1 hypothetical protein E5345_08970 [Propionibacterium sp. NM47_B9-13]
MFASSARSASARCPRLRVAIWVVIIGDAWWGCRPWVRNPDFHNRARLPAAWLVRLARSMPVWRHS